MTQMARNSHQHPEPDAEGRLAMQDVQQRNPNEGILLPPTPNVNTVQPSAVAAVHTGRAV